MKRCIPEKPAGLHRLQRVFQHLTLFPQPVYNHCNALFIDKKNKKILDVFKNHDKVFIFPC